MKISTITSLFAWKKRKAAFDLAGKIEELSYKLIGLNPEVNQSRGINEMLENSYRVLEKLRNKLEEERNKKHKDFTKNSGFITAKVNLSINNSTSLTTNVLEKEEIES